MRKTQSLPHRFREYGGADCLKLEFMRSTPWHCRSKRREFYTGLPECRFLPYAFYMMYFHLCRLLQVCFIVKLAIF